MSAVIDTTMADEPISDNAVTAAREKLAQAEQALARARDVHTNAKLELQGHSNGDEVAITQHTERLQRWVLSGHSGTPPVLVTDIGKAQAKLTAQATLEAAQRSLKSFEALVADAGAVLEATIATERAAVARAKSAHADRIADELIALREHETELVARLTVARQDGVTLSFRAEAALNNAPCRPTSESLIGGHVVTDIHSPLNGSRSVLDDAWRYWSAEFKPWGNTPQ